jgi:hypothetical protein
MGHLRHGNAPAVNEIMAILGYLRMPGKPFGPTYFFI